jgi:hypothetical protein
MRGMDCSFTENMTHLVLLGEVHNALHDQPHGHDDMGMTGHGQQLSWPNHRTHQKPLSSDASKRACGNCMMHYACIQMHVVKARQFFYQQ